jgi:hypothetical protein
MAEMSDKERARDLYPRINIFANRTLKERKGMNGLVQCAGWEEEEVNIRESQT